MFIDTLKYFLGKMYSFTVTSTCCCETADQGKNIWSLLYTRNQRLMFELSELSGVLVCSRHLQCLFLPKGRYSVQYSSKA